MIKICIFGDSITQGACDSLGGWAQRLKDELKKSGIVVHASGVDGDTSTGLLQRLEREAAPLKPDIIIIAIGINDSIFYRNGRVETSLAQFQQNMGLLIKIASKLASQILILGLTSVDERKTKPVPWNDCFYSNEKIKQYDNILREVSEKAEKENNNGKVEYIELFSLLSKKDLADGLHPTDEGHRKIFELVKRLFTNSVLSYSTPSKAI